MLHAKSPTISQPLDCAIEHGGDLAAARRLYPDAPQPWIDLSTGINPHAWPCGPLSTDSLTRLPAPAALAELERIAAAAYGLPDATPIVAAPGAQALIQALPRLIPGRRVGVLGPTYAEHAASWRYAGREVVICAKVEQLAACDIAVVVNPNNPDGRIVPVDVLLSLSRATQLVVDESFADFTPAMSFAAAGPAAGALVLRSFGKAYGLAGVRLGFAIGPQRLLDALRADLGPWAVSGPAIEIGTGALADVDWRAQMADRLGAEARRLDALLAGAGCTIVGGASLFRLADHARCDALAERLGRAGVYVRRFAENPRWMRLGLPPQDGWARLEAALANGAPS